MTSAFRWSSSTFRWSSSTFTYSAGPVAHLHIKKRQNEDRKIFTIAFKKHIYRGKYNITI